MNFLETFKALSDESRLRLINILNQGLFSVQELTSILGLSQSTISHHLKILSSVGLAHGEKDGTYAYYTFKQNTAETSAKIAESFLNLIGENPSDALSPTFLKDNEALKKLIDARRDKTRSFFDTVASDWKHLRNKIQGDESFFDHVIKHLSPKDCVVDLGCGSGALLDQLLPRPGKTMGVDYSEAMLDAARNTLGARAQNVDLRLGYLEHLPIGDTSVDVAVMYMVMHHVVDPKLALADALRILRPDGTFIAVDLISHTHQEMRERFADLWLGFDPKTFASWMKQVGFTDIEFELLGEKKAVFIIKGRKNV